MENDTAVAVVPPRPVALRDVFQPRSLEQALDLADRVAASEICPTRYRGKPGDVFVAAAYGAEIGLSFMQSVQGVVVINGIPTIYGDHALGVVRASGLCQFVREWIDDSNENNLVAHCVTHRKGEPEPVERTFSEDDAERAGLLGKTGPWQTHEKRMLQMRARGFCLRDTYADVMRGLHLTEELEGESLLVDSTGPTGPARRVSQAAVIEQIPMPRALNGAAEPATTVREAAASAVTGEGERRGAATVEAEPPRPAAADDAALSVAPGNTAEPVEAVDEDAPARFDVISVTQRTRPEPEGVTFAIVLHGGVGGTAEVVARTRDRALAALAREARRAERQVVATFDTDTDLGVVVASMVTV